MLRWILEFKGIWTGKSFKNKSLNYIKNVRDPCYDLLQPKDLSCSETEDLSLFLLVFKKTFEGSAFPFKDKSLIVNRLHDKTTTNND